MNHNIVKHLQPIALEILKRYSNSTEQVEYVGEGAQSVCFGAGQLALLISQEEPIEDVRSVNSYPLQQWMAMLAVAAKVKTAEILDVGDDPLPFAVMHRARGLAADRYNRATKTDTANWFRRMGTEVRKINSIPVKGFGVVMPSGNGDYSGEHATWSAYLDACIAKYLFHAPLSMEEQAVRDLFFAQGILSENELDKIESQLNAAKSWGIEPVLIHYDNRLANLIVDDQEITLVDWGLAYAGIGLPQELIKVTEAPDASAEPTPMHAFLEGYGLAEKDWPEAIERGMLMLLLDGFAMSYAWAKDDVAANLVGIRNWLTSIKRISDNW